MSAARLDQILSRLGYCSRREAAAWVKDGRITLACGTPVLRTDQKVEAGNLRIGGQAPEFPDGLLILLHKPAGCACSHDPAESPLVYDLLPSRWLRRNPVPSSIGRLDRDTSGLLLVTDDGALSHRLASPRHGIWKCYEVTVTPGKPLEAGLVPLFASGTLLLKGESRPCLPAQLEITGPFTARLRLHEGKYHQVRRMFASQGHPVTALHRSALGPLTLENLAEGQWRALSAAETAALLEPAEKPPAAPGPHSG